jgi:hypothetical protein
MKVKPYITLNTSRKHVNYEEDKNKVPMNKPYSYTHRHLFLANFFYLDTIYVVYIYSI